MTLAAAAFVCQGYSTTRTREHRFAREAIAVSTGWSRRSTRASVTVSRTVSPALQIYRDSAAQNGPRLGSTEPNRLQIDNF
jgi:hypothetical protein